MVGLGSDSRSPLLIDDDHHHRASPLIVGDG